MHSRKQLMFAEADAFVSLPGGLGTLDETVEIITWRQLGLHDKPILLCDIAGSAAPLLGAIDAAIASGFASARARDLFEVTDGGGTAAGAVCVRCLAPPPRRRTGCSCLAAGGWGGYIARHGRSVAQPGRALCSGRRGRRFESSHSDHSGDVARAPLT